MSNRLVRSHELTPFATHALLLAPLALAQPQGQAATDNAQASAAGVNGAQIANQGGNGAAPCASCHGANGEGNAQAGFPRLAGQSAPYLAKQLASYSDGSRQNPIMTPIAKALNDAQRQAVSQHYATLDAPGNGAAGSNAAGRGSTLATVGDEKLGIQGCANCHGPEGRGEAPAYPYLAGQHATYLRNALAEWKNGARTNDPSGQMVAIAKALTDADITALATYYASRPAPPARVALWSLPATRVPAATSTAATPASTSNPQGQQGIGTEQGAATVGGGQGPGGGGTSTGTGSQGSQGQAPPH